LYEWHEQARRLFGGHADARIGYHDLNANAASAALTDRPASTTSPRSVN